MLKGLPSGSLDGAQFAESHCKAILARVAAQLAKQGSDKGHICVVLMSWPNFNQSSEGGCISGNQLKWVGCSVAPKTPNTTGREMVGSGGTASDGQSRLNRFRLATQLGNGKLSPGMVQSSSLQNAKSAIFLPCMYTVRHPSQRYLSVHKSLSGGTWALRKITMCMDSNRPGCYLVSRTDHYDPDVPPQITCFQAATWQAGDQEFQAQVEIAIRDGWIFCLSAPGRASVTGESIDQ